MTNKDSQHEIQCSQFEALLADALDGVLSGESRTAFDAHAGSCAICGPMLAEAREGLRWLETLEEVEPPRNLVHNILAATSLAAPEPGVQPMAVHSGRFGFRAFTAGLLRSRFVTSFCMAFFSLSVTLSVAGVRLPDLANAVSHPGAVRKAFLLQYTQVESSVLRYYENMRLVYEVESRVKALRKATTPPETNDQPEQPKKKNSPTNPNDTSGSPETHPDYSKGWDGSVIAESTNMKHEGVQL
jgi:hypothetical protein